MKPAPRAFTGWHMVTVLVAFFGVVIAVNLVMARYARSTFGGTVVDNSYVASQQFNDWLVAGAAQDAAGWQHALTRRADGRLELRLAQRGTAVTGAQVSVTLTHPLGREASRTVKLLPDAAGTYLSREAVPAGRWHARIAGVAAGQKLFFVDEIAR